MKKIIYNGKEYNSRVELAKKLNISPSTINKHLTRYGTLDKLGIFKIGRKGYSKHLGLILNNKQIIHIDNKIHVQCLKCKAITVIPRPYIHTYLKTGKCKHCEFDKRFVYKNLEYKGKIYKTVSTLAKATGLKIGTIGACLRKHGNLNSLGGGKKNNASKV